MVHIRELGNFAPMKNLHYLNRASKNPGAHPLIVQLHGYGSHEGDLFSFERLLNSNCEVVSFQAPHPLPWGGYAWYEIDFNASGSLRSNTEQALESIQLLHATIQEYLAINAQANPHKVCLMGFSQGAILSLALAFTYPEHYQAVAALSGYLNLDFIPNGLSSLPSQSILQLHGTEDPVIAIEAARQAKEILAKQPISYEYHEFAMAHGISQEAFSVLLNWLSINGF